MPNPTARILLVDDDPTNLLLLEELMLAEGYVPLLATSGTEALEIIAQSVPDLILLDVMMPDMDGFEVCRQLREDARFHTLPVIFLTALDDDHSRLRGLQMMGDDYLTKPINSKLLLTKIASILRLNALRSQKVQLEISQKVKEQSRQQIAAAWEINDYLSEKFRLFVPEQYLNRIAPKGVESIQLGNAREELLTVLFCDIRGFTAMAESQSAQETFEWLNAFFSLMSQAITEHHGFVDKFLGDAILAVFDRVEHHAADALNAAVTMLQRLSEFNRDRDRYKLEQSVNVGIGIHTGLGVIGTVGSDKRMDSTVIGDVVNTAARLEELTKIYGCQILASDTTMNHISSSYNKISLDSSTFQLTLNSYPCRWVDRVTPRGKRIVLELYEILGTPTQVLDVIKVKFLSCYNSGLQAWHQEDYPLALSYFQQLVERNPNDTVAKLHVERCQKQISLVSQQAGAAFDGFIAG
ncbi:MAG: response regulator [Cyanobacteriota bacterium]